MKRFTLTMLLSALVFVNSAVPLVAESRPDQSSLVQRIRHELVMLPFYGVFDNLRFRLEGTSVILAGQVSRPAIKTDAEQVLQRLEGVGEVINRIEVLPPSPDDDRIRLFLYRALSGNNVLGRYLLTTVPSIHIIVRRGDVVLEGVVGSESEKVLAGVVARGIEGVHSVTNHLRVDGSA